MNQQQSASNQYGLTLKRILSERKISISTLARRLELPSRNTIHRILAGNSKFESVEKIHRKICSNQTQLHFRDEDIALLREALDCCRYGKQGYAMRRAVMDLIIRPADPPSMVPCICRTSNLPSWCGQPIEAVIELLADYAEVEILLLNAVYPPVISALQNLLARGRENGLRCRIQHVLCHGDDAFAEMQQLVQLQPLLADPHYTGYRINPVQAEESSMNSNEQTMIICKRSHAGLRTLDRISFLSARSFAYCVGLADDDGRLAQYYADYAEMLIAQCVCLNPKPTPEEAIANLLALNAEFAQCEQCWSQILIKPDLCISQIPTEYMMRLIRDSGYLGLSPDAPEIEEFERVHRQRYENFVSGKHGYVFIFSEAGMRRFMETGRLSDHVPGLPAFTVEERRRILIELIKLSDEKPGMMMYMFRGALVYSDTIFNLFNDEVLYLIKAYAAGYGQQLVYRNMDKLYISQVRSVIRSVLMSEYIETPEATLQHLWEMIEN